jgi:hypothetical protein
MLDRSDGNIKLGIKKRKWPLVAFTGAMVQMDNRERILEWRYILIQDYITMWLLSTLFLVLLPPVFATSPVLDTPVLWTII